MKRTPHDRIIWAALILSWIIIFVGIRRVFYKDRWTEIDTATAPVDEIVAQQEEKSEKDKRFYVWEPIMIQWNMWKTEDISLYTHIITNSKNQSFWLKSKDIDLYKHSWDVSIKWSILDIKDDMPVVWVTELIPNQKIDPSKDAPKKNPWFTFYKADGIAIDLPESSSYVTEKQWEDILVIGKANEQFQTVLSVSPFVCTTEDALKDCAWLEKKFKELKNDSFTSDHGVTYYNMTETSTRLAFDWEKRWIYVRPFGENNLVNFVKYIHFLDTAKLESEIKEQAEKQCKNLEYKPTDESKITFTEPTDGSFIATITSNTIEDASKKIICKIQATLWAKRTYSLLSVAIEGWEEEKAVEKPEEKIDEVVAPVAEEKDEWTWEEIKEEPKEEKKNEEIEEKPEEEEVKKKSGSYKWRAHHSSVRGYDMYFSNPKISYLWGFLWEWEKISVWGTECTYGTKVTLRENADNIAGSPDVIVYECPVETDISALPEWVRFISKNSKTNFLRKNITGNLGELKIGIE